MLIDLDYICTKYSDQRNIIEIPIHIILTYKDSILFINKNQQKNLIILVNIF